MKLFQLQWEEDGETTKEPGRTSTKITRHTAYYAASSMLDVWDATKWIREDPERTYVSLAEVAPLVTVVPSPVSEAAE